jgi:hypothetical protein
LPEAQATTRLRRFETPTEGLHVEREGELIAWILGIMIAGVAIAGGIVTAAT